MVGRQRPSDEGEGRDRLLQRGDNSTQHVQTEFTLAEDDEGTGTGLVPSRSVLPMEIQEALLSADKAPPPYEHPIPLWRRRYMVILFATTAGLLFADQNLLAPNLSAAAADFNFDDVEKDEKLGGYIMAAFFAVGAPAALAAGILADKMNRVHLLFVVILLGEAPCMATYWVTEYWQFFVLRTLTGISVGGCFPLVFSLLGDLFPITQRSVVAAVVQISTGVGIAIGQLVAAGLGPVTSWRLPFVVISAPAMVLALLMVLTVSEPPRGGFEEALREVYAEGGDYHASITWSKARTVLSTPTNWLCIMQGLPGSMPWGMLLTFFNDFLHVQKGFTVQVSTLIILLWGLGGALGVVAGGAGGQALYNTRKEYLPLLMAACVAAGVGPLYYLVNAPLLRIPFGATAAVALFGGAAGSVAGPNLRAIVLNVNEPETRGLALALLSMSDDVGRGAGPFFVSWFIKKIGRRDAFNVASGGWIPCALILVCITFFIRKDESAMQARLQRQVEVHQSKQDLRALEPSTQSSRKEQASATTKLLAVNDSHILPVSSRPLSTYSRLEDHDLDRPATLTSAHHSSSTPAMHTSNSTSGFWSRQHAAAQPVHTTTHAAGVAGGSAMGNLGTDNSSHGGHDSATANYSDKHRLLSAASLGNGNGIGSGRGTFGELLPESQMTRVGSDGAAPPPSRLFDFRSSPFSSLLADTPSPPANKATAHAAVRGDVTHVVQAIAAGAIRTAAAESSGAAARHTQGHNAADSSGPPPSQLQQQNSALAPSLLAIHQSARPQTPPVAVPGLPFAPLQLPVTPLLAIHQNIAPLPPPPATGAANHQGETHPPPSIWRTSQAVLQASSSSSVPKLLPSVLATMPYTHSQPLARTQHPAQAMMSADAALLATQAAVTTTMPLQAPAMSPAPSPTVHHSLQQHQEQQQQQQQQQFQQQQPTHITPSMGQQLADEDPSLIMHQSAAVTTTAGPTSSTRADLGTHGFSVISAAAPPALAVLASTPTPLSQRVEDPPAVQAQAHSMARFESRQAGAVDESRQQHAAVPVDSDVGRQRDVGAVEFVAEEEKSLWQPLADGPDA